MRRFVSYGPAFVVLLTAGTVLLAVPGAVRLAGEARTHETVRLARQALDQDDVLERLNAQVRNIAESVEPSVVHIDVRRRGWRASTGSGWVYDDGGHVITNAHVVGAARRVLVQFHNGRVEDGEVVGTDPLSDIAVIRVESGEHLVPAERASGQRIRQGDRVFAFGSPFGFKFSMSEGIVSGLGRSARAGAGQATISNFIQTDAAVNPGNSGGPLVDVRGRVVGMNVAIANAAESDGGTEGQSAGISFAIPLGTIESRVEQLIESGAIQPGYLGIQFGDVDSVVRDGVVYSGRGALVASVVSDGPADRAGLRSRDIVLALDGEEVTSFQTLRTLITNRRPGSEVVLRVLRGDEELSLKATLDPMPGSVVATNYQLMVAEQFGLRLVDREDGPEVVWPDPKISRPEGMEFPKTPARDAGFTAGQRIVKVGTRDVETVEEALLAMEAAGLFRGEGVLVEVREPDEHGNEFTKRLTLQRAD